MTGGGGPDRGKGAGGGLRRRESPDHPGDRPDRRRHHLCGALTHSRPRPTSPCFWRCVERGNTASCRQDLTAIGAEELLRRVATAEGQDRFRGRVKQLSSNVSRTAIWKHVKALGTLVTISKPFRPRVIVFSLPRTFSSRQKYKPGLDTSRVGKSIVCFPETDSTNLVAFRLAEEGAAEGTVVIADAQIARQRAARQGMGFAFGGESLLLGDTSSSHTSCFRIPTDIPLGCGSRPGRREYHLTVDTHQVA